MRVIGFDPGTRRCGYAVIEAGPCLPYQVLECGMVGSTVDGWGPLIVSRIPELRGELVVGVEKPSGYVHHHARGAALLETANVAGKIAVFAYKYCGLRIFESSPQEWRRAICGKSTAGDALVKLALARYVRFAKPNQRTSNHVRDAAGVAVTAAMNPKAWT